MLIRDKTAKKDQNGRSLSSKGPRLEKSTPPPVVTVVTNMSYGQGHSGDFGNTAKMVGKMSKSVMQLMSIGF